MRAKHILLVDDDPLILELLERALAEADFRVSKARRVALARDVLCRQSVDLVITDARIPGESGIDLAESARALGIAVMLMSGDPEWAGAHGLGPGQYLAKPFETQRAHGPLAPTALTDGRAITRWARRRRLHSV